MGTVLEKKPFIIADVGTNWKRCDRDDYNLELAFRHIDDARRCGCDAVKFQFFTHRELYGVDGPDPFALPVTWLPALAARASVQGIEFMCTAFSPEGALLVNPYVQIHKIASSELQYWELINTMRLTGKPIVFSTGGASVTEWQTVHEKYLREGDAILECVSDYPALSEDYDFEILRAPYVNCAVGISDHTTDYLMALAAAGAGATIFEKHFDALGDFHNLSEKATPDGKVSASPEELTDYCHSVKLAVEISQNFTKRGQNNTKARLRYNRRLKVTKALRSGDRLQYGVNFGLFRSLEDDARAASPEHLTRFEGAKVKREMEPQEGLWFDDIE